MTFNIEKVANMIYITSDDIVYNSWEEDNFTERKLKNATNRILKNLNGNAVFNKTF
ncbi:hypothetical protein OBO34_07005 [Clostridiales Family XIII bacterium ASD5510]|uniref:Uncharacterized protein n=1 Tax=Hominibacterium faecale TaxID=2839743 RepID=A0A9J6QQF3_9FIRM|nr:hypothetical protein [Hominibacterium faecale]MCU7378101.1 hypothetical protein [Hominibacterium faecale]